MAASTTTVGEGDGGSRRRYRPALKVLLVPGHLVGMERSPLEATHSSQDGDLYGPLD